MIECGGWEKEYECWKLEDRGWMLECLRLVDEGWYECWRLERRVNNGVWRMLGGVWTVEVGG